MATSPSDIIKQFVFQQHNQQLEQQKFKASAELQIWNKDYEEQLKAFFDYSDKMVMDRKNDLQKIAN